MQGRERADELVVTTPELVAFDYELAGLGSRFLAQLIDLLLLAVVILVLTLAAALSGVLSQNTILYITYIVGQFALVVLYFPVYEAVTNGQTLGKRAMRLPVVGDRREPLTPTHVPPPILIPPFVSLPALSD